MQKTIASSLERINPWAKAIVDKKNLTQFTNEAVFFFLELIDLGQGTISFLKESNDLI